jgi:hypothetical protein
LYLFKFFAGCYREERRHGKSNIVSHEAGKRKGWGYNPATSGLQDTCCFGLDFGGSRPCLSALLGSLALTESLKLKRRKATEKWKSTPDLTSCSGFRFLPDPMGL